MNTGYGWNPVAGPNLAAMVAMMKAAGDRQAEGLKTAAGAITSLGERKKETGTGKFLAEVQGFTNMDTFAADSAASQERIGSGNINFKEASEGMAARQTLLDSLATGKMDRATSVTEQEKNKAEAAHKAVQAKFHETEITSMAEYRQKVGNAGLIDARTNQGRFNFSKKRDARDESIRIAEIKASQVAADMQTYFAKHGNLIDYKSPIPINEFEKRQYDRTRSRKEAELNDNIAQQQFASSTFDTENPKDILKTGERGTFIDIYGNDRPYSGNIRKQAQENAKTLINTLDNREKVENQRNLDDFSNSLSSSVASRVQQTGFTSSREEHAKNIINRAKETGISLSSTQLKEEVDKLIKIEASELTVKNQNDITNIEAMEKTIRNSVLNKSMSIPGFSVLNSGQQTDVIDYLKNIPGPTDIMLRALDTYLDTSNGTGYYIKDGKFVRKDFMKIFDIFQNSTNIQNIMNPNEKANLEEMQKAQMLVEKQKKISNMKREEKARREANQKTPATRFSPDGYEYEFLY